MVDVSGGRGEQGDPGDQGDRGPRGYRGNQGDTGVGLGEVSRKLDGLIEDVRIGFASLDKTYVRKDAETGSAGTERRLGAIENNARWAWRFAITSGVGFVTTVALSLLFAAHVLKFAG